MASYLNTLLNIITSLTFFLLTAPPLAHPSTPKHTQCPASLTKVSFSPRMGELVQQNFSSVVHCGIPSHTAFLEH